jgi:hypothetical protein
MARPRYVYKYQPPNDRNIENLVNRAFWCADPRTFNDPFDCAASLVWNRPRQVRSDVGFDMLLNGDDEQLLEMAVAAVRAESELGHDCSPIDAAIRDRLEPWQGVVCFSEQRDNLLMWSHYAAKHGGYCLEFDTRGEFWDGLRSVKYQANMPTAKQRLRKRGRGLDVTTFLLAKARDWKYEKEWRLIRVIAGEAIEYPRESLKAVYLGAMVLDETAEKIVAAVGECSTKVVQMELAEGKFRLRRQGK